MPLWLGPPGACGRGLLVSCLPDTGASQSLVSAEVARDTNLSIWATTTELRNASKAVMSLVGEAEVVMCNDKHSTQSVFFLFLPTWVILHSSAGRTYKAFMSSLLLSQRWQLLHGVIKISKQKHCRHSVRCSLILLITNQCVHSALEYSWKTMLYPIVFLLQGIYLYVSKKPQRLKSRNI